MERLLFYFVSCFIFLFIKTEKHIKKMRLRFVAAAFDPVTIGVTKMNKVGAIFCFH